MREVLLKRVALCISTGHGIGHEMIDVEWNPHEVAEPEPRSSQMFTYQIPLMEACQAVSDVECRVEK
jgi:hypothetical protein